MAVATLEPQVAASANQRLISEQLRYRLVNRIVKDEGTERPLAERILDQALGFLRLCALEPNGHYSPSSLVDIGWHTLIMYTRDYAALCDRLGGGFIHHEPSDVSGVDYGTGNVSRTVSALKAHSIHVDEQLWLKDANDCSSYCSGDSCSGGGGDGDPGCKH
jgi:hypothetical protein